MYNPKNTIHDAPPDQQLHQLNNITIINAFNHDYESMKMMNANDDDNA
jgi:hypothetical protein